MNRFSVIVSTLALAFVLSGCGKSDAPAEVTAKVEEAKDHAQQAAQEANAAAQAAAAAADLERKAWQQSAQTKYDDVSKKIEDLKDDAKADGAAVKAQTVAALDAMRDKAKAEIDNAKNVAQDGWRSTRESVDTTMTRLEEATKAAADSWDDGKR